MGAWCRSCGLDQTTQSGPCPACGVDLVVNPPDDSPIGLVYDVRGKLGLGHKQGICLGIEGDSVLLHFSAKDKEQTRLPITTTPIELVSSALSPATRLLQAADLIGGKLTWDAETIRKKVAELCADVRVVRAVTDEALTLGWQHIIDWVPLTDSEKAWRSAHHAASTGDGSLLLESLVRLPTAGYSARGELVLPHLGLLRHDTAAWLPVLASFEEAGIPAAHQLLALAVGPWDQALAGSSAFLDERRGSAWGRIRDQLSAGVVLAPPPSHDTPAWAGASLMSSADRARPIDAALDRLLVLEVALLDDLVDQGRLTKDAALTSLRGRVRTYLLARLDPNKLTDDEVRDAGHVGEYARRLFLSRDKATLSGLDRSPRVAQYQALLDVIEGRPPDPHRLDAHTIALLELPSVVLERIKDGDAHTLPREVAADPSLWPMFADLAVSGKLLPDPDLPADDPLNVWVGLQRLLGLVWEGRLGEAVEHGRQLIPNLKLLEYQQHEALNLTAYALDQLGRVDDALALLEDALQGTYTENLLVNASIVASKARPEVGLRYLARLVEEAPTTELQRAGLDRAISVWQGSDLDFPSVLVPALRTVLSTEQPLEDYLRLSLVVVNVASDIIGTLPNPGGELDGPYRMLQIRGRWKNDSQFFFGDLAAAYVELYRSIGRPAWFAEDWAGWVDFIRDSVFVDLGDALGSAQFIDTVMMQAPELFTREETFLLAPLAGAHMSFAFRKNSDSWLTDTAMDKFFTRPIDQFLSARQDLAPEFAEFLAANFTRTAALAVMNLLEIRRPQIASEYNAMNDRRRWDHQNFHALSSQMMRLLQEALTDEIPTIEAMVYLLRRVGTNNAERRDLLSSVAGEVAEWRSEAESLLRNL